MAPLSIPGYEPAHDPLRTIVRRHPTVYRTLARGTWTLFLAVTALDFLTTFVGIEYTGLVEQTPASRYILRTYGWAALALKDVLTVAVVWAVWRLLPAPYRVAIPATAALPRAYVVLVNLSLLL